MKVGVWVGNDVLVGGVGVSVKVGVWVGNTVSVGAIGVSVALGLDVGVGNSIVGVLVGVLVSVDVSIRVAVEVWVKVGLGVSIVSISEYVVVILVRPSRLATVMFVLSESPADPSGFCTTAVNSPLASERTRICRRCRPPIVNNNSLFGGKSEPITLMVSLFGFSDAFKIRLGLPNIIVGVAVGLGEAVGV